MKTWHAILFIVALVVFAAALAPIGVIAPQRPGVWQYSSAQGNVWNAAFADAKIGTMDLGSVEWRMRPSALFTGAVAGDARFSGGLLKGDASVRAGALGGRTLRTQTLSIEGIPWRGGTLAGVILLRDLDIAFRNGRCNHASGLAESDILLRNVSSLGWAGPALKGEARCAGADAVIGMVDVSGDVEARVTLRADGSATWRLGMRSASGDGATLLANSGFAPDHTGAPGMEMTGDTRWAPF